MLSNGPIRTRYSSKRDVIFPGAVNPNHNHALECTFLWCDIIISAIRMQADRGGHVVTIPIIDLPVP